MQAVLTRSINQLVNTRRPELRQHPIDANDFCFRGGGLPDEHQAFYTPGRKYRVPGFLATSMREYVATGFADTASLYRTRLSVVYYVHLDPRGRDDALFRCRHVNLLNKPPPNPEVEFLFAPYSVFTVTKVEWAAMAPHEAHKIHLEAALDNLDEYEDLPLAPWY